MRGGLWMVVVLVGVGCTCARKPDPLVLAKRCTAGVEAAIREEPDRERMRQRFVASCRELVRDEGCRRELERVSLEDPSAWLDGCAKSLCPSLSSALASCAGRTAATSAEARRAFGNAMLVHDWGEAGAASISAELEAMASRFRDAAARGVTPWSAAHRPESPTPDALTVRIRREGQAWRASFVNASGEVKREVTFAAANPLPLRLATAQVVPHGATVRLEPGDDVNYVALVAVLDALRAEGARPCIGDECTAVP